MFELPYTETETDEIAEVASGISTRISVRSWIVMNDRNCSQENISIIRIQPKRMLGNGQVGVRGCLVLCGWCRCWGFNIMYLVAMVARLHTRNIFHRLSQNLSKWRKKKKDAVFCPIHHYITVFWFLHNFITMETPSGSTNNTPPNSKQEIKRDSCLRSVNNR